MWGEQGADSDGVRACSRRPDAEGVDEQGRSASEQLLELRTQMVVSDGDLRLSFAGVLQALPFVNANEGLVVGSDPSWVTPSRSGPRFRDDYVTGTNALTAYGVVITADGSADEEATQQPPSDRRRQCLGRDPECEQRLSSSIGSLLIPTGRDRRSRGPVSTASPGSGRDGRTGGKTTVSDVRAVGDYLGSLEMAVRERHEDLTIMVAPRSVRDARRLLGVEVLPTGFAGYASPQIARERLKPLATPV